MSKIDKNGNIDITSANPHIKQGVNNGTFKESKEYTSSKSVASSMFNSIFFYIVLVLFAISYSHYIRTGTFIDFSFKSLIDRLAQMPDVSLSFASIDLTINGDWGSFDFIRDFLNFFGSSFEVILTLSGFVLQGFVVIFFLCNLFFI